MCVCACTHTECVHVYTCVCMCTHVCACVHMCVCMCTHGVCACVYACVCMCVHTVVCMCVHGQRQRVEGDGKKFENEETRQCPVKSSLWDYYKNCMLHKTAYRNQTTFFSHTCYHITHHYLAAAFIAVNANRQKKILSQIL